RDRAAAERWGAGNVSCWDGGTAAATMDARTNSHRVPAAGDRIAARSAGLRYVTDQAPGLHRRRRGARFAYFDHSGRRVRNRAVGARVDALAIPPAYTQVWISPDPDSHIQATARDARGRKQYRYHSGWRALRDSTKFERMAAFGVVLPRIRSRV